MESLRDPGFPSARERENSGLRNFQNPGNIETSRERRREESGRVRDVGTAILILM